MVQSKACIAGQGEESPLPKLERDLSHKDLCVGSLIFSVITSNGAAERK